MHLSITPCMFFSHLSQYKSIISQDLLLLKPFCSSDMRFYFVSVQSFKIPHFSLTATSSLFSIYKFFLYSFSLFYFHSFYYSDKLVGFKKQGEYSNCWSPPPTHTHTFHFCCWPLVLSSEGKRCCFQCFLNGFDVHKTGTLSLLWSALELCF